jgi:hypothetical protein
VARAAMPFQALANLAHIKKAYQDRPA